MGQKIYYKVLNNDCESVSAESRILFLCVQYKENDWVYPRDKRLPLLVFDSYEAAENWAYLNNRIYKCEIKRSRRKIIYCESEPQFREMMQKKKSKKRLEPIHGKFPKGTVFADAVRLIKRVR